MKVDSSPIVVFSKAVYIFLLKKSAHPFPIPKRTITATIVSPSNGTVCLPLTIIFLLSMMPDEINIVTVIASQ